MIYNVSYLFYPEEGEQEFYDSRRTRWGRGAGRAYRFQNSAEDQKSRRILFRYTRRRFGVYRRSEPRRPWLNFEHDPAALVCPIQRRISNNRFSNANNLFPSLYPTRIIITNGKKKQRPRFVNGIVNINRKGSLRNFEKNKKKGERTFEKIFKRIFSIALGR